MKNLTTGKAIRYSKMIIVLTVGALALFVIFGNITDYLTNFQFVKHVMSMDAMKDGMGGSIMYRAITNPLAHNISYIFIIAFETIITLLCFIGAYKMWKHRNSNAEDFHQSKLISIIALTCCCLLWFFGFQVVGAEWFGMWMSNWNGLPDATRLVTYMFMGLIFVSLKND